MHRSYRRVGSSSRAHMALERELNKSSQVRAPEESSRELDVFVESHSRAGWQSVNTPDLVRQHRLRF